MKLLTNKSLLTALALGLLAFNASAVTITFNGSAPEGSEAFISAPYSEAGYTLTQTGGVNFFVDNSDGFPGVTSFDDDVLEFNSFSNSSFVLTKNGGGNFNLVSVKTGSLGRNAGDDGMFTFTGHFAGGGTISTTVLGLTTPATTAFTGFNNLVNVTITSADGEFPVMDDLIVTQSSASVPDSGSTFALLGLAITTVAGVRRKLGN